MSSFRLARFQSGTIAVLAVLSGACAAGSVDDSVPGVPKTDSGKTDGSKADSSWIDDTAVPDDTASGDDTGAGIDTSPGTDTAVESDTGSPPDGSTCSAPKTMCGGVCTDTSSDPANCGSCGTTCATSETCAGGVCTCKAGTTRCGTTCVDTSTSTTNCGSCGVACATGATCVSGTCVGGTPKCNASPYKVLFYGPVGSGETAYLPAGATTTIATDVSWKAMTTATFKTYSLIVIGTPTSGYTSTATQWDTAFSTRTVWGPAVTGRVAVTSLDPNLHTQPGASTFLKATLQWASSGPGTGLFVGPDYGRRKLDFMSTFGSWTALGQATDSVFGDAITINLSTHGTMTGSTAASLSSWGYSYHGAITAFPAGFSRTASATSPSTYGIVVANDKTCTP